MNLWTINTLKHSLIEVCNYLVYSSQTNSRADQTKVNANMCLMRRIVELTMCRNWTSPTMVLFQPISTFYIFLTSLFIQYLKGERLKRTTPWALDRISAISPNANYNKSCKILKHNIICEGKQIKNCLALRSWSLPILKPDLVRNDR